MIVANYRGAIHAFHGLCPHRHNPLEGATLWDHLLDCPYHHFQFDVRTGENYFPKTSIRRICRCCDCSFDRCDGIP